MSKQTFPLTFIDTGETIQFDSQDERIAQMWAARIGKVHRACWYNPPSDPGLVHSTQLNPYHFFHLDINLQLRVWEIVNPKKPWDGKREPSPEAEGSPSFEVAVERLLANACIALGLLDRLGRRDDKRAQDLKESIEDVQEWINGMAEENETPRRRGWVGHDGQP